MSSSDFQNTSSSTNDQVFLTSLQKRFLQVQNFLKRYQNIWKKEIMLEYPRPLNDYPCAWISEIEKIQGDHFFYQSENIKEKLIQLEKGDVHHLVKNEDLLNFFDEIKNITHFPSMSPSQQPMPTDHLTWLSIVPKKQHEIKRLAPYIHQLYQNKKIEKVIDVGGGIGFLAQSLSHYYDLNVISLDYDPHLQETGRKRQNKLKMRHEKAKSWRDVEFQRVDITNEVHLSSFFKGNIFPVGLHACGRLSVDFIRTAVKQRVPLLISFGCCYHSLGKNPKNFLNISQFAKNNQPLWANKFALTLSSRAHTKRDAQSFRLKIKVKFFRYAFHILLHDYYGHTELVTLGNSHPSLYEKNFSDYALEQFKRLDMNCFQSKGELDQFFNLQQTQKIISQMFAAGVIRNALSRVSETYLLLDRALFLEENGYEVQVEEFFDYHISPRNIGITASLK